MKKVLLTALAGSAIMLGGCEKKAEEPAAEATPAAESSAEASSSDAAGATASDAASADDAEPTSGGAIKP